MSSVKSNLKERFEIELQETRETSLIAELIVARTGLFSLQENVIPLNKILNLFFNNLVSFGLAASREI